jgi:hypothetical protein
MTDPRASLNRISWLVQDVDPIANDAALVSFVNKSSDFTFNFATAWFPAPAGEVRAVGSMYLPSLPHYVETLILISSTFLLSTIAAGTTDLFWNLLGAYRHISGMFGCAA